MKLALEKAGLDGATLFTLLTRAWQAAAGVVTLTLVAYLFPLEVQGYYYTFSSLLALQVFVELGLYLVVMSQASHQWSQLEIDGAGMVVGDATSHSRLASLLRFVLKWYACVGVLFIGGAGVFGFLFLASSTPRGIDWHSPWIVAVLLGGIQLMLLPLLSILEGCNQVAALSRFRFFQAVAEAVAIWISLAIGAGLWVVAVALLVKVAATIVFIFASYRRFFVSVWKYAGTHRIAWAEQIWPMQWRLAAQGMVNYFLYSLFVPLMFHFQGAKTAGQMGMTLQVVSVIQLMSLAWIQTKVPRLGMLVASRQFAELDKLWRRTSILSFTFAVISGAAILLIVVLLHRNESTLAERILGPLPTGLFLLASAGVLIVNYFAAYLRAFGREPFVVAGVLSGLLSGALVFLFGSRYGATGAASAYVVAILGFTLPFGTYIWFLRRLEWRGREA